MNVDWYADWFVNGTWRLVHGKSLVGYVGLALEVEVEILELDVGSVLVWVWVLVLVLVLVYGGWLEGGSGTLGLFCVDEVWRGGEMLLLMLEASCMTGNDCRLKCREMNTGQKRTSASSRIGRHLEDERIDVVPGR